MNINCNNKFNWGQININLVNEWDKLGRGASSYWSTRNRSAPLPNLSHPLEINVDLTPIILNLIDGGVVLGCVALCIGDGETVVCAGVKTGAKASNRAIVFEVNAPSLGVN